MYIHWTVCSVISSLLYVSTLTRIGYHFWPFTAFEIVAGGVSYCTACHCMHIPFANALDCIFLLLCSAPCHVLGVSTLTFTPDGLLSHAFAVSTVLFQCLCWLAGLSMRVCFLSLSSAILVVRHLYGFLFWDILPVLYGILAIFSYSIIDIRL